MGAAVRSCGMQRSRGWEWEFVGSVGQAGQFDGISVLLASGSCQYIGPDHKTIPEHIPKLNNLRIKTSPLRLTVHFSHPDKTFPSDFLVFLLSLASSGDL